MSQVNPNNSQNYIDYSKRSQNQPNIYSGQNNYGSVPQTSQMEEENEWGARPGISNENIENQQSLQKISQSQFGDSQNQKNSNQIGVQSKLYKPSQEQSTKSENEYYKNDPKITDNGDYHKNVNASNIKNDSNNPYNSNSNNNNGINENNIINNNFQNIMGVNSFQKNSNVVKIDNNNKNISPNNINLNNINVSSNIENNNINKENNNSSSYLNYNAPNNNYFNQSNNNIQNNQINNNNIQNNQINQSNNKIYDDKNYKKQANNFNNNIQNNNMNIVNNSSQNINNNKFQNNIMNSQMNNPNNLPNSNNFMNNSNNNNFPNSNNFMNNSNNNNFSSNNNFMNDSSNNNKNSMGYENKNINYNNNMNNQNINNIMSQGNINSNNKIMTNQNNSNINSNLNIQSHNQNNQNNPNQNKILTEVDKFSFSRNFQATKTGLINIVETSYLNAVLQLIGSFHFCGSYFLNPNNYNNIYNNIRHKPLSFVIQRLFLHLYPEKDKKSENYKPQSLKQVLAQLNPVYKSNNKRNPNELLSFILNTLHDELNITNNNTNQILYPNNNDRNSVTDIGFKNYKMLNNSIISDNLTWFEIKQSFCKSCKNNIFHFNTFNTFELDIIITYNTCQKPISILDCLQYYNNNKSQILICRNCGKKSEVLNKSNIYISPNIFIFSLDRQNLDNNVPQIPFIINEKIDIIYFLEKKEAPSQYQLTGILSYWMDQNKYISFCLSPIDNQWYFYNDEKIELTQINNVINNNNCIPCILVYKSMNLNE